MARDVVWRMVVCRGSGCGAVFYICGFCYRGQAYCGAGCRAPAQRQQRRNANRRYQRSLEGRLDLVAVGVVRAELRAFAWVEPALEQRAEDRRI